MTTGRINQVANPSCVRQSPHATPRPGRTHRPLLTRTWTEERCDAPRGCERAGSRTFHFWFVPFLPWPEKRRTRETTCARKFLPSARHPFPPSRPDPIHRTQKRAAVPTAERHARGSRGRAGRHMWPLLARPRPSPKGPSPTRGGSSGEIRRKGPQRSRVLAMPYSPPNRRSLSNPRRALRSARLGRRDQLKPDHRTDGRLH